MATSIQLEGQIVSHYRVVRQLGGGGMGVVYAAEDLKLGRQVALKFLTEALATDSDALERLRREARAASALNHPNICTIHDIDEHAGQHFIVMELLEGQTLKHRISGGPLTIEQAAKYGAQISDALEAAHAKGIIHRDIKPANIFVDKRDQIKVLDFGLAKLLRASTDETLTQTITQAPGVLGTLPYMPPEQLKGGGMDARVDIYSVGAVLYEMVTGRRPFREGTTAQLIDDILHHAPAPPGCIRPGIPARAEEIILKCLDKVPEKRYQSAKELAVDLQRLTVPSSAAVPVSTLRGPVRGRWTLAIAGASLLALLTVVIMNVGGWRSWLLHHSGSPTIQSLAVLPLENMTGDASQEYFSDGMTDELITELAKLSALKVISRTSVMQYKGTKKTLPQISRELGVDGIIEGSVAREGEQVRITVQLLDGPNDRHLWADTYQRELRGVLALQSELARAIASQINIHVSPEEQGRLTTAQFVNPEAHEAYLKAQSYFNQQTEEAYRKGLQAMEQSVTIDPNYALGYAGLSQGVRRCW